MFGQDSDPVGEFCSLNVVYHLFSETQNGAKFSIAAMGCWILARPTEGGKCRVIVADYLTVIYPVADNNGLFWGFR